MLKQFQKFILENNLVQKNETILIACSGGKDSMVMTDLFLKAGYKIALAHCNFQLRGKDADADEKFIITFAKKNKISFLTKKFETESYATQNKISIQMAARKLRYEWFEFLRKKNDYSCIATAHHQTDLLETMLINLTRGTGLSGLHGILAKQNQLIRPLLFATREMIDDYAQKNKIRWREDVSNSDDKYVRNKIRHHILPILKEINPSVENTFYENALRFKGDEMLIESFKENLLGKIITIKNETIHIAVSEIKKSKSVAALLYLILKDYGFANDAIYQIQNSLDRQSGKKFLSSTDKLIVDRDQLIVSKIKKEKEKESFIINKNTSNFSTKYFKLHFEIIPNAKIALRDISPDIALFDASKIKFPLTLRTWHKGDYFFPFGMKGKRKKLSDFFTDIKLSVPEKSNCFLMTSENEIVWVMNQRTDERYRVTAKTTQILKCIYTSL